MREPGDLAYERGDDEEAARLYRLAAEREGEHGSVSAAFNLGCLLRNCERPSTAGEAKQWLESAARRGHRGAMAALGRLLKENEDAEGAESWFRAAGEAAWFDLGFLLLDQKQTEEAERYYRLAADAGDPDGIYNLAVLLHERGDVAEAERWYETAAAQGDQDAMFGLGVLHKERGDYDGADDWYLRADELGHREATVNLGFSARFRGDLAAAEQWFLRAVNEGNKQVLCSLGIVIQEQGRLDEAERWYRRASAAVGMSSGQDNLRALQRRRRYPEAQCFFHHDTSEALWLRGRATDKLERGDRWRRPPAAWTPSAVPVGRPGAPFRIDLTSLEAFDSGDPNFPWAWFEPRTGNATLMDRSDLAIELPEPHELDDWRRIFAQNRASNQGCLLEMDIRRLGGRAALYQLWKQRQSRNERGFAFFAVYVVPTSRGTAALQYQASEGGTTGVRETLVVVKLGIPKKLGIPHPYDPDLTGGLPYLRADEPAWDEMFPDHPLSQARVWSRVMERTAVLEDE